MKTTEKPNRLYMGTRMILKSHPRQKNDKEGKNQTNILIYTKI